MKRLFGFVLFLSMIVAGNAQTTVRRNLIRAAGEGVVAVTPDQVKVTLGVTTQAANAQDASSQNATQVAAVIDKLKQAFGTTIDIRTLYYSLSPNYNYPGGGGTPVLTGYTASNTVEVTATDLTIAGKIIDTATQGGANRVESLQFSLKNDQAARAQALRLASIQAKAHADAIALGLGVHLGAVISASEGSSVQPVIYGDVRAAAATTTTPVSPGNVEIRSTVTLEIEIAP